MQEWRLARQETLLGVQLIVSIQQRYALLNNTVIYVTLEKQKKRELEMIIRPKLLIQKEMLQLQVSYRND